MRGGILALGIIILVVGGLIFMKGYNGVKDCESTWGEIGQIISEEARVQCERYEQMETFGGIIGVIGFVISIAGGASSPKRSNTFSPLPPSEKQIVVKIGDTVLKYEIYIELKNYLEKMCREGDKEACTLAEKLNVEKKILELE